MIFLINGFAFLLIGLQLPAILAGLQRSRRRSWSASGPRSA